MREKIQPAQIPPKPASRPEGTSWIKRVLLFRKDMFSSQPEKLYRAKMAQMRTPFFDSFLINSPDDVREVLAAPNSDFPKSGLVSAGLKDLLGNSVFTSNGEDWARARRIIDPVFEGGNIKSAFPSIVAAGHDAIARLRGRTGAVEFEAEASELAADVIFRVIFSRPISHADARSVFDAFQSYQRTQPLWNLADILRLPRFVPRMRSPKTKQAARQIRALLGRLVDQRLGTKEPWPEDMLSGLIKGQDPETGTSFSRGELIDQIAIFFLAGHETSASALSWGLYLLAIDQESQHRVAAEVESFDDSFSSLSNLAFTRNVFRETLRLYPPVPMMLRDAGMPWKVRGRQIAKGSLIILSPWHLGRHQLHWPAPDAFDPQRWEGNVTKAAHIPFSAGPRVCAGASFAMAEGLCLLAMISRAFEIRPVAEQTPIPVAHLTLRSKNGIWLNFRPK